MNILFVHNNFPAQYRHLAGVLGRRRDVKVAAIGSPTARPVPGVALARYSIDNIDVSGTHPFARRFDLECHRAEQVVYNLTSIVSSGFVPDVVIAHPGWGEALPLRALCNGARIILYCEFYYGSADRDVRFDPEFPSGGLDADVNLHLKNAATLLGLTEADSGIAPTRWQRSTFPDLVQPRIDVVHEGVDVDVVKPSAEATFRLPSGRMLTPQDEVVTYVSRSLEPVRGFHSFMRALPRILDQRPKAHAVIVGAEGVSYGSAPPGGASWKETYLDEVSDGLDLSRVHFVGRLPYADYLALLQVSSAHIYLTYPFVLSWSCLEAMAAGCVVVGSDTAPVREVIDGTNGILVPFFDPQAIADAAVEALEMPGAFAEMREAARQTVLDRYDAARRCVPEMLDYLKLPIRVAA